MPDKRGFERSYVSAGSAALGPPNLGREAPDPCGLLSSQPEQDLYLFLSSFVIGKCHVKSLKSALLLQGSSHLGTKESHLETYEIHAKQG